MSHALSLVPLLGALTAGAISPGPSFAFVARISMARSRKEGVAAAVGMGLGAVIFAILVMLGLHAVLVEVWWLFVVLKVAGSAYLIYMGIGLWRSAKQTLEEKNGEMVPRSIPRAFVSALGTQLSNPKAVVVYGSIFAGWDR